MAPLALAWRLARRELRSGLGGFRIFLVGLGLGVAAIAAVGSLTESLVAGLRADGRALLGGDVDLRLLHRAATADQEAHLAATAAAVSRIVEMRAMARPADGRDVRAMVELKAVDGAYPLVGAVRLEPSAALAPVLAPSDGVWGAAAEATLLDRLGVGVGDRLRVGEALVEVRAVVIREPDRIADVFNFGPRLMIAADALLATGLVQPGSMIRYHTRVGLGAGADVGAWIEALKHRFPDAGWRIRDATEAAPGIRRFVDRMSLFLTFAGLTALLVGGIGVGSAVRNYLDGKTTSIAILKCLGAPGTLIFRIYLLQVLALAALGVAAGVAAGAALPVLGLAIVADALPIPAAAGWHPRPLALAGVLGLLTATTFAVWPLAAAREVPPGALFRAVVAPPRGRPRPAYVVAVVFAVAALAALIVATAADRPLAIWFVGGAMATLAALRGGAALLMAAAARLPRVRNAELRLALAGLHRPGAPTPNVVLSMGTGIAVLVAVALIEGNLRAQIDERLPSSAPAFFFIDIPDHQAAAFDETVRGVDASVDLRRVPSLRGRIVRIAGVPVEQAKIAAEAAWAVRGDRSLTYAAAAPENARIAAGAWWPADYAGPPAISLDAGIAAGFGVGVGDTLTLTVLGREIEARIASLRDIDWRAVPFDFALIFAPGTLERAPHSHIAAVFVPPAVEAAVEKAVADRFVSVTAIRVREALEAVNALLAGIGHGVRAAASLTVVVGALVLGGAIAAGRRRRRYDAIVFKVLGATRARIARMFVYEYGLLGLATGIVAAAIGTATAWAVTVYLMRSDWVFLPWLVVATVAVCIVATQVIGFAGTWRVLGQKTAPALRNE
ncbi:MAG: ABC transporter permease [Rhodospirillales bacterium]